MNKNILLLSYVFPPYPGIGGRRWAKFAKYLSRKGYTVHVICAKNPFSDISLWMKDVQNDPNIIVYPISPEYPSILLRKPVSVVEKIMYRFNDLRIRLAAKGNPYERAVFWRNEMLD